MQALGFETKGRNKAIFAHVKTKASKQLIAIRSIVSFFFFGKQLRLTSQSKTSCHVFLSPHLVVEIYPQTIRFL